MADGIEMDVSCIEGMMMMMKEKGYCTKGTFCLPTSKHLVSVDVLGIPRSRFTA